MRVHRLTEKKVSMAVPDGVIGNYWLGNKSGNEFFVKYVGRSDTSLRTRLIQHAKLGKYKFFRFKICYSKRTAFVRECLHYHEIHGADNKIHPGVNGTLRKCPICSFVEDFLIVLPNNKNKEEWN